MKKTLVVVFLAVGATLFAAANTYKVSLLQESVIDGKTFKAGDYKIVMENGNAVIKQGKETFELPARVETESGKALSTEITYKDNSVVKDIWVGGTRTKIVFEDKAAMPSGQ